MSFRNRCQIAGALGVLELSVPLAGGRAQKGLIRDVRIAADRNWQARHWRTITSCYNRSPWFEYYRDGLESLFAKRVDFLLDWNLSCFEWTLRVLGLSPTIAFTEEYRKVHPPGEVADWRGRLLPRDREKWGEMASPRYYQVFEDRIGFQPNLSILDLLFCEGKEAIRYIRSSGDGKPSAAAGVFPG